MATTELDAMNTNRSNLTLPGSSSGGKKGVLDLPLEIFEQVSALVDHSDLLAITPRKS